MKNLLGIRETEKIRNENIQVIAELAFVWNMKNENNINIEDLREGKIYDFVKPARDSLMTNRIIELQEKAIGRIKERNGKLMNGIGIFSIVGEYIDSNIDIILVDPYWHSYAGMLMISPEILKYVDQNQVKLGEILAAKKAVDYYPSRCTTNYCKGRFDYGALNFFYTRVSLLEYIARICEIDIENYTFDFHDVGKVSLKELIDLRKTIAERSMRRSWRKYLEDNPKARKIFLEICGFKTLDDISTKKVAFEDAKPRQIVADFLEKLAGEPRATTLIRSLGQTYYCNLVVLLYLIEKKQTLRDLLREASGKQDMSSQMAATLSRLLSNYDVEKALFDKTWKEVEQRLEFLQDESVKQEFEDIKNRINFHIERLRSVEGQIKETIKSLKDPKSYVSGVVQYWLAELLFLFGISLGINLIKKCFDHFVWLVKDDQAKIGLGIALTAIFIVGINIEGDWISLMVDPKKTFVRALKEEIIERGKSVGGRIKDAITPDSSFAVGMIIGGFATVLKSLGIPFYTTDELCDKLCEWIKVKVNREAGVVLQKILSFEIPLINQKIFDLLVGFVLGGPAELIADTVIGTILEKAIMPAVNSVLMDLTINILMSTML